VVVRFIGGGNQSTLKKTSDLSQVIDKLSYIMLLSTRRHERNYNSVLVVIL
jgi:hypothetical protein